MGSARIRWKPQAYIRIRAESIARAARQALLIETPPKGIAVRQSLSSMNTKIKYLSLSVGSRRLSKGLCLQAIARAARQALLIETPPLGIAVRQSERSSPQVNYS
jgi:hypothetical protein